MQLLQRSGCGGYVTALTASRKSIVIKDKNRDCPNGNCDSYDYSMYKGRTLSHVCAQPCRNEICCISEPADLPYMRLSWQQIRVRYGQDGVFGYKVQDLTNGKTILEYNVVGDMGSSSSVKVC